MNLPIRIGLGVALAVVACQLVSSQASAQIATVAVVASKQDSLVEARVTVRAKFKEPSGGVASGDYSFTDLQLTEGVLLEPAAVTKDGFRYEVKLLWKDDTVEATAKVRSQYGSAVAVGSTKL